MYKYNNYAIVKDEIYSYLQLFQLGWRAPLPVQAGEDVVLVGHNYVNSIKPSQLCLFRKSINKVKAVHENRRKRRNVGGH